MSIREEWKKLVDDRELFKLDPLIGDRNERTVILSQEMHELLTQEMEEGESANRRSRLLATLQNIVAGRRVVVCLEPFNARKANMGRLSNVRSLTFDVRINPLCASFVVSWRETFFSPLLVDPDQRHSIGLAGFHLATDTQKSGNGASRQLSVNGTDIFQHTRL
jgi:hypothetical protein